MKKNLKKENSEDELIEKVPFETVEASDAKERQLLQSLQNLMEEERIFLNPDLTIAALAKYVGTNKTTLSHIINKYLNQNFSSLLNKYRIRESVRLLSEPSNRSSKIETIGEMCGYSNRQTFHSAFKKEMGITPSHFRNITKKTSKIEA